MEANIENKANLKYVDSHIHMTSRSTDDYINMTKAGIVAIIEPAFWLGQPRTNVGSFIDYFSGLVGWERFRASQFGIYHYCTIGMNAKEANDTELAKEVIALIPRYAAKSNVVAIGEIGFDEMTKAEEEALHVQIEIAKELDLPIQIHTPHRNKKNGTSRTMDILEEHDFLPNETVIDHNNEETVQEVLDRGYWAAFTIYPKTKMGNQRMVNIVKQYGSKNIIVDSSADWGMSDPLAVPKTANLMYQQNISIKDIEATCFSNALVVYGKNKLMTKEKVLSPLLPDQVDTFFEGNSVLRGQESNYIKNIIE